MHQRLAYVTIYFVGAIIQFIVHYIEFGLDLRFGRMNGFTGGTLFTIIVGYHLMMYYWESRLENGKSP